MSAKQAYADFLHDLLAWLPQQAGGDASLAFMIRGARIQPKDDYEHVVSFPGPGRRRAYLRFAQNMCPPYDRRSKVFALTLSIGSVLRYAWLEAEAGRTLPGGRCGTFDYGRGEIFFVQWEWGEEGDWDRLYSSSIRRRLFQHALEALLFANRAFAWEVQQK